MYKWLNYKGKWKVVILNGDTFQIAGSVFQLETKDVPEDLWGPFIHPPRDRSQDEFVVTEISTVQNAADKENIHDLLGKRYFCPDFTINSQRRNDCGVVTIANILGITYSEAKLKCFHAGWSSSRGISDGFCEQILEEDEFHTCYRKDLTFGYVQDFSSEGTFLIHSAKHIMPAKNDIVHNQQGQGKMRIDEVCEVREKIKN